MEVKIGEASGADKSVEQVIDPLRRVFVPIEKKTAAGTTVFKTLDGEVYARLEDGSIRRARPKMHGKQAKKLRRHANS